MSLLVDDSSRHDIKWTTPISKLIRNDFVLEDEYATNHLTIEDALSHRSSMPGHDLSYESTHFDRKATVKDNVQSMRFLPLTAEPLTKFQYCNLMCMAASHVIETLTGEWLGDVIARLIWKPLGMTAT